MTGSIQIVSKANALKKNMDEEFIKKNTSSYHDWLIESLRDEEQSIAYLETALAEYIKDGYKEAFLKALHNVAEAQGDLAWGEEPDSLDTEKTNNLDHLLHGLGFKLSIAPVEARPLHHS